jgi:hypothetical protein
LISVLAVLSLAVLATDIIVYQVSDLVGVISEVTSVLFLLVVASFFLKGRTNNTFNIFAVGLLLLNLFVMPLIRGMVSSDISSWFAIIPMFGIGAVFFILLILESRKQTKGLWTAMFVLAIIMVIGGVFLGFVLGYLNLFLGAIASMGEGYAFLVLVLLFVYMILEVIIVPVVLLLYTISLKRERGY